METDDPNDGAIHEGEPPAPITLPRDMRQQSGKSAAAGWSVAVLGAVVAQPLAFLIAFVMGAIFGAHTTNFIRNSATAYGIQGGMNGMQILFFYYICGAGIPALIISAIGAGLALAIRRIRPTRRE